MRTMAWVLPLFLSLGVAPYAAARPDGTGSSAEARAADQVLRAHVDADDAALTSLARAADPDPWLVVDVLLARGEREAAAAFGRRARGPLTDGLAAYVASREEQEGEAQARRALEELRSKAGDGLWQEVVDATAAWDGRPTTVTGIRTGQGRGLGLQATGAHGAAHDVLIQVAAAAERIGWIRMALSMYDKAAASARRAARLEESLAALDQRLRLTRPLGNPDFLRVVLNQRGIAYFEAERPAEALRNFDEALVLAEAQPDASRIALCLLNRANARIRLSQYAPARADLERAAALLDRQEDAALLANVLHSLADVLIRVGELRSASTRIEEALEVAPEADGESLRARLLLLLGSVFGGQGRHAQALQAMQEALDLARSGQDVTTVVHVLHGICGVHVRRGAYLEGRRIAEEALSIASSAGYPRGVYTSYALLGAVNEALGNQQAALEFDERALEGSRSLGSVSGEATARHNLGNLRLGMGELGRARVELERAIEIRARIGDRIGLAESYISRGLVLMHLGDHRAAVADYLRALEVDHEVGAASAEALVHLKLARAFSAAGLGDRVQDQLDAATALYRELGDADGLALALDVAGGHAWNEERLEDARRLLEEAVEVARESGGKEHLAASTCNLGLVYEDLGDVDGALATFDLAAERLRSHPRPAVEVRIDWGRARVHLRANRPVAAIEAARRAIERSVGMSVGLSEGEGASAREIFGGLFDVGYRAAVQLDRPADLFWIIEQARARTLLEALGSRRALESAAVPRTLLESLNEARSDERRAREAVRVAESASNPSIRQVRSSREARDAARSRLQDLELRMRREAKAVAAVTLPEPEPLEDFRARLGPAEALLLYVVTTEDCAVLVVEHDAARIVRLESTEHVHEVLSTFQDSEEGVRLEALQSVRAVLIDPLDLSEQVEQVSVSPMGRLDYLPWSLLFEGRRHVTCVPSASALAMLRAARPAGEGVLAVGAPEYGSRRLAPLPESREEVASVGDTVLVGSDATEARLSQALARRARWRVVHLACHGLIDSEHPLRSSLALTAGDGDDGVLTVLEAFRTPMPTDLLVLSACDTARGRMYATEGILGLPVAFLSAGASQVLCSLWKVDDAATRALMIRFHELLKPGPGRAALPAARALRAAQQHVREQEGWEAPRFWAAWTLWGRPD